MPKPPEPEKNGEGFAVVGTKLCSSISIDLSLGVLVHSMKSRIEEKGSVDDTG